MTKPSTPAEIAAEYRKTFPKEVNDRRLELVVRRHHADFTDAERAELAECNRVLDEWESKSPWQAGGTGMTGDN